MAIAVEIGVTWTLSKAGSDSPRWCCWNSQTPVSTAVYHQFELESRRQKSHLLKSHLSKTLWWS